MFRILVADDEGIMRESIRSTIESNFGSDCELVTAKTGREVIELAESFRPDIAFVDIQMPGLSGIQAIKEVQQFNSNIVFVIITAYDRFAYAQEAVNLGVMEYMTKPINKKKIVDVCVRAMRQVEEARQKRSDDLRVREKLEIVIPMIENAFINNLLQEDKTGAGRGYLDMLDIPQNYAYMAVLEFGESDENGHLTNAVGSNVRANQAYHSLREIVGDFFSCIIGPVMGNRIVLYIPVENEKTGYEQRVEIITRIRNMVRRLEDNLELRFRVGIGNVREVSDIYLSYREAIRALTASEGHVVHIMDVNAAESKSDYPIDLENHFYQMGLKSDITGCCSMGVELLEWMSEVGEYPFEDCKVKVLELLLNLERRAQEAGTLSLEERHRGNYLSELQNLGSISEVRSFLMHYIQEICSAIEGNKQKESERVVSRVVDHIREHFAEDITLDDVSRMVDISPYYFSKLFKQEMGVNYIEYLTDLRIQKAKEYMANPKYSIKEVCSMCGYSDPNYFSRIFKKYVGVSPSEYRQG
ncbi:MAG: AraC family transcriptional regulator [Lachnospiraceae bacterium]|nr:AraC family transcriptional regulator [Lachnospiraceae bacterium]